MASRGIQNYPSSKPWQFVRKHFHVQCPYRVEGRQLKGSLPDCDQRTDCPVPAHVDESSYSQSRANDQQFPPPSFALRIPFPLVSRPDSIGVKWGYRAALNYSTSQDELHMNHHHLQTQSCNLPPATCMRLGLPRLCHPIVPGSRIHRALRAPASWSLDAESQTLEQSIADQSFSRVLAVPLQRTRRIRLLTSAGCPTTSLPSQSTSTPPR